MRVLLTAAVLALSSVSFASAHGGNGASGAISAGPGDYASSSGHTAVSSSPGNPSPKSHTSNGRGADKLPDQNPNKR